MSASFSQSSLSSVCFCNLQRNRLVYLTKSDLHVLFQLIQYVCVPPISLSAWRKTSLWKISLAKSEATDFVIHCRRQMFIRLSRAIPYVMETKFHYQHKSLLYVLILAQFMSVRVFRDYLQRALQSCPTLRDG
jgi:hypothetical protein